MQGAIAEAAKMYRKYLSIDDMYAAYQAAVRINKTEWTVYRNIVDMQVRGKWSGTAPERPELRLFQYKKSSLKRYLYTVGLGFNKRNSVWKKVAVLPDGWVVVQSLANSFFYVSHHHEDGRAWYTADYTNGRVHEAHCPKCKEKMPGQCAAWMKIEHLNMLLEVSS